MKCWPDRPLQTASWVWIFIFILMVCWIEAATSPQETTLSLSPKTVSDKNSLPPFDKPALRVCAVGDIMMGSLYPKELLPPGDGAGMFDAAREDLLGGDIVFGNLEGCLADSGVPAKACRNPAICYLFRMPTRYAGYLAEAGFNALNLANNHSRDFGLEALGSTIAVLEQHGIQHAGLPGDVAGRSVGDCRVVVVAFGTNQGLNDLNDLAEAARIVTELKQNWDLVIVSFHGGAEGEDALHVPNGPETYLGENRGHLRAFAHAVVDAGAALVLGHGPHVPRGMEIYHGRLIAYSLGNFYTWQGISVAGARGLSVLLQAELAEDGAFLRGSLRSLRQSRETGLTADPQQEALQLIARLSQADFPATYPQFTPTGEITPPQAFAPAGPGPVLVQPPPVPLTTPEAQTTPPAPSTTPPPTQVTESAPARPPVHFQLRRLADGVFAAVDPRGGLSNAGIVDLGDTTLVFDTMLSTAAAQELVQTAQASCAGPIAYVVNSHHHKDHHWGNQVFPPGVKIISTAWTRDAIIKNKPTEDIAKISHDLTEELAKAQSELSVETDPKKKAVLALSIDWYQALADSYPHLVITPPNLTIDKEMTIYGSKRRAQLISYGPGSTGSDLFLYLPDDKILFAGDLVFIGMHPILSDGAPGNWRQTLQQLLKLDLATVVPGHGPVGTPADITIMTRYLDSVEGAAKALLDEKKPAEAVADLPVPVPFDSWFYPGIFIKNVKFVYGLLQSAAGTLPPPKPPTQN